MRNGLWSIVIGGIVGALVWAAPVGARPFPRALKACLWQLNTCSANLQTCQTDLAECEAAPSAVFPGDGHPVASHGPALSYTDNGDGTFTDNNTLFMWEKKVAGGSAGTCDLTTNLHGVDSTCPVEQAVNRWIPAINAANLGGHNDWRMPNVKELQSIVDYGTFSPASSVPGSTAAGIYCSFTSSAGFIIDAWFVDFGAGSVLLSDLDAACHVRAVRGGR